MEPIKVLCSTQQLCWVPVAPLRLCMCAGSRMQTVVLRQRASFHRHDQSPCSVLYSVALSCVCIAISPVGGQAWPINACCF